MANKIKLKTKPEKPVNGRVEMNMHIGYSSIADVLKTLEIRGIDPSETSIEYERGYYDDVDIVLTYHCDKYTEEEYKRELDKYEEKLKSYNDWYELNKKQIEEYQSEKKLREEKAELKKLIKEKRAAENKIKKLEKQIKE